ncbi:aminoglycoside phosphotransferase family protein [Lacihabitans sp. LS3-19]|uniref:phosphotransferase enzyme family protein n=1 Tax=Lacihabitans sp. LS3-19 TaxID=2487335 RepID=UPI0020CF5A75|nr:phosphotransferase [Lacihabitans sp. LS3-19]MCP9768014.1 aminoglycoside phosphotransferase family protein [Lacihabitans sp. LS3-19]
MEKILEAFGLCNAEFKIKEFGSGHINSTYLLESQSSEDKYILQKINVNVFKNPYIIAQNIGNTSDFLKRNHPEYLFIHQIQTKDKQDIFEHENEFWRLTQFIPNSYSINTLDNPEMAFDAAKAFGLLAKNLHGMDLGDLQPSIPGFHDLAWRYEQFEESLTAATEARKKKAKDEIDFCFANKNLVETYKNIVSDETYPIRMMHHDTKINNVLFDKTTNKSLAVCDLDTLMPGRIISDLGDMVRTSTSAESEESINFSEVKVREEYFEALVKGYVGELKSHLTASEKQSLIFAGPFMIYMQGLRFLADYLNNDIYYPVKYPEHNLNRAINQRVLLEDYYSKEVKFAEIIENIFLSN